MTINLMDIDYSTVVMRDNFIDPDFIPPAILKARAEQRDGESPEAQSGRPRIVRTD